MPDYRLPYGELPWSIVIVIVISKTFVFFIVSPIAAIIYWFKASERVWVKRLKLVLAVIFGCAIFFGLLLLSTTLAGTTPSAFIKDLLLWLSKL